MDLVPSVSTILPQHSLWHSGEEKKKCGWHDYPCHLEGRVGRTSIVTKCFLRFCTRQSESLLVIGIIHHLCHGMETLYKYTFIGNLFGSSTDWFRINSISVHVSLWSKLCHCSLWHSPLPTKLAIPLGPPWLTCQLWALEVLFSIPSPTAAATQSPASPICMAPHFPARLSSQFSPLDLGTGHAPKVICLACFTCVGVAMAAAIPIFCHAHCSSLCCAPPQEFTPSDCTICLSTSHLLAPLSKNRALQFCCGFIGQQYAFPLVTAVSLFESNVIMAIQKLLRIYGWHFGYVCYQEIRQCLCQFSDPECNCHSWSYLVLKPP